MRSLHFVKFLNQDNSYEVIIKSLIEKYHKSQFEDFEKSVGRFVNISQAQIQPLESVIQDVTGLSPSQIIYDNHSRGIAFGDSYITGSCWDIQKLALDRAFISQIELMRQKHKIELITNTYTTLVLESPENIARQLSLAQSVVINHIPVSHNLHGPILPEIDRLRGNEFLAGFREKMIDEAMTSSENISEITKKIEKEFIDYRNDVLIEKQKGAKLINSFARNAVSLIIPIPGITEAADIMDAYETRKLNWTAFMATLESDNL